MISTFFITIYVHYHIPMFPNQIARDIQICAGFHHDKCQWYSNYFSMNPRLTFPLYPTMIYPCYFYQWIGLRENLQESPIFNGEIHGFLNFPLNQSIDSNIFQEILHLFILIPMILYFPSHVTTFFMISRKGTHEFPHGFPRLPHNSHATERHAMTMVRKNPPLN